MGANVATDGLRDLPDGFEALARDAAAVRQALTRLPNTQERAAVARSFTAMTDRISAIRSALNDALLGKADPMQRRDLLKLWPLPVVAGSVPFAMLERVASAARVDPPAVEAEAALGTAYAAQYDTQPVDVMTTLVAGHLTRARRFLDGSMTPQLRTKATGVVADAAAFAGWLAYASDARRDAARMFALAESAALESGDTARHAAVLLSQSELLTSSHPSKGGWYRPDLDRALDLAEQAYLMLPASADPRVRSWVCARLATLYAGNGTGGLFYDRMDEAHDALADPVDPAGQGFFSSGGRFATWDQSLLSGYESAGLLRLGRADSARVMTEIDLVHLPDGYGRRRVNTRLTCAAAYLASRDIDAAVAYAVLAAEDAKGQRYPLGLARVRTLRARMQADAKALRDLDAVLA